MGLKEYSDEPEKKVEKKPINENPPKQEPVKKKSIYDW
jgi:hypothetical protein